MCVCVYFSVWGQERGQEERGEGERERGREGEREYENMYVGYVSL